MNSLKHFTIFCSMIGVAILYLDAEPQTSPKKLYVFSATHFDLNFTGPPPFSLARNHRIFDAALQLADVPFEIVGVQSTIVRSIQIRFRAQDVPPLGWKAYYLRPAETPGDSPVHKPQSLSKNEFIQIQFVPSGGTFTFRHKATSNMARLDYYHQPVSMSPGAGFFREKEAGKPVSPKWSRAIQGTNLAGPYLEVEGKVLGAGLKLTIQLDGTNPVSISETLGWQGGKRIKLVRRFEFPEKGRFIYGVPYGTQELDNLMPKSGPPKEGSFDELPRDHWLKNREYDGWAAWCRDGQQITVASEARGGAFDGRSLKMNLLNSSASLKPFEIRTVRAEASHQAKPR